MDATFTLVLTPGPIRLVIEGDLDLSASAPLSRQLAEAADASGDVLTLDLAGVRFVDCCGLRPLEEARQALEKAGKRLEIAAASAFFRRVSALAGYAELAALCPVQGTPTAR